MMKYIQLLVVMLMTTIAGTALAWNPPPSPKPSSNILDQAKALTPQELGRLNSQLNQINNTSANEIGVLIVPSLNGEEIRTVGYATGRAWGVGKRELDNGVMIVWSPGDHKIGIETGKGVEGDLPDLKCNDIIRNIMIPQFKGGHYEAGLSHAFVAVSSAIAGHRAELAERDRRDRTDQQHIADTPHTTTTSTPSGGCDVAGVPNGAVGFGVVWLLLVGGVVYLFWRRHRADQESHTEWRTKMDQFNQDFAEALDREIQVEEREQKARLQQKREEYWNAPHPTVAVNMNNEPVTVPVTPEVVQTTDAVHDRLQQLAEERQRREEREERQARRDRERRERQEEETAILAAAAVAAVASNCSSEDSEDDADDDSSSNSSPSSCASSSDDSSPDPDFGGGDFGGGGSSSDY